jgi:hypothetical protein
LGAIAVVGLATLSSGAQAQYFSDPPVTYEELDAPTLVHTALSPSGTWMNGRWANRYALPGLAGQTVVISLESSAFDAFVQVAALGSRLGYSDDNDGEGSNALLQYTFPEDGIAVILVTSVGSTITGDYVLRVSEPHPKPLPVGRWLSGELSEMDPKLNGGGLVDMYWFTASAGETYTITMRSTAFDSYLVLRDAAGETVDWDDDGGDGENGTDAQLTVTIERSGRYRLLARSSEAEERGTYSLLLERGAATTPQPTPSPRPQPASVAVPVISIGQRVAGEILASDWADCAPQARCDLYAFDAVAGSRLTITLVSDTENLDPVLVLFGPDGRLSATNDDDPNNGRNSRIDVTIPTTGRYRVGARSYSGSGVGRYVLEVRRAP